MNTLNEIRYAELSFTEGRPIVGEFKIIDGWFQLENNDGIRLYNPQHVWRIIPLSEDLYIQAHLALFKEIPF